MLILTSDNGMPYGAQRVLHDKKVPYGTQIPFYVRWPRVLGHGAAVGRRAHPEHRPGADALRHRRLRAGTLPHRPVDGRTAGRSCGCSPASATRSCGTAVLTSYQEPGERVPTYWSVTSTGSSPLARVGCAQRRKGGCRWMYTEYETGETELYDLSNGPCYAWKRRMRGDPCMLRNKAGLAALRGHRAGAAA